MRKVINFILLIVLVPTFTTGCMEVSSVTRKKFSCMGTQLEIIMDKSVAENRNMKKLFQDIKDKCESFEENYSYYDEDSVVNKINKNIEVRISEETEKLLKRAKEISSLTNGAFDITVAPLMELWGFYKEKKQKRMPKKGKIDSLLKSVGYKKITINEKNNLISKMSNNVKIDLSGIAKGLLVDNVIDMLEEKNIRNAIVNAGGDMYCLGKSPDGEDWSIGIQHPRKKTVILGKVNLSNMAIATSGDYENYFTIKGKRYAHIMNPSTGYPVSNSSMGVTVIASDTATADGLSTAVIILGAKKGMSLINDLSKVEGVIIEKGKKAKVSFSRGLKEGKYNFSYKDKNEK